MNYSLDAVWWRLTDQKVRDLVSILTAPPLWHSGCELGVHELLGKTGFRYLLSLNDQPEKLHQYLAKRAPFSHRLGFYAESLLAFWLGNAPHTQLYAHNLEIADESGRTIGSADFVTGINGQIYHLELACKYYGCRSGNTDEMVGLNLNDRMIDKMTKLNRQLLLLTQPRGQQKLASLNISPEIVKVASVVRGMAFTSVQNPSPECSISWQGSYIDNWQNVEFSDGLRYYLLPHMDYLAPARVSDEMVVPFDKICLIERGLVAELEKRPDGFWHETKRIMKQSG